MSTQASPRHQATAKPQLDFTVHFTFALTYCSVSALNIQEVPGYATADASFSWNVNHALQLSAAGQNLLQPRHPQFAGDPGAVVGIKRGVYGQITWKQ